MPDATSDDGSHEPEEAATREESVRNASLDERRSRTHRALVWCIEFGVGKVVAAVLLVGALVGVVAHELWNTPAVPRWAKIAILVAVVTAPYADKIGKMAVKWLWQPDWIYVVDLDAREQDGAIYRWPLQAWQEVEVVEGQLDWLTPNLAVGKDVNQAEGTIRGTWRGTRSDAELLRDIATVNALRGDLEDHAKAGAELRGRAWFIIQNGIRDGIEHVIETAEWATLPDEGDALRRSINEALEDVGLEDWLDSYQENEPMNDLPTDGFEQFDAADLQGAPENGADAVQEATNR